MNFYDKNLLLLKEKSETVYEMILSGKPIFNYEIEQVEDTFNYIIDNGKARCFLHSIYGINEEMNDTFKYVPKDVETIILFGFGCGYYLEYIIKNYNNVKKVVIIEPSLQLFDEVIKHIDLEYYLKKIGTITFCINFSSEFSAGLINDNFNENLKTNIVYNLSYKTIFLDYFNKIEDSIRKNVAYKISDISTVAYIGKMWMVNSVYNLFQECISLEKIINIFRGKPAVLVSAGPSLNKNIELLNKVKDKAIIIAVGSAIKILEHHGIKPHFRMAVDGQPQQKKMILEGIDTKDVPILFGQKLYKDILQEYEGRKIRFIDHSDYFGQYIYRIASLSSHIVTMGSSVANGTLSLFCTCGCSKVIFLGQDLCYTGGELHAKGAFDPEAEKLNIDDEYYTKTKDIFGNEVYTKPGFLSVKHRLEEFVDEYQNQINFINATEGGLGITGAQNKTLQAVLEDDLIEDLQVDINSYIEEVFCDDADKYMDKINKATIALKDEVEEILRVNNLRMKQLKKINKRLENGKNPDSIIIDLKGLNSFENTLTNNQLYSSVIMPSIIEIIKAIELTFKYIGDDKFKMAKSIIKVTSGVYSTVDQYATIIKLALQENSEKL